MLPDVRKIALFLLSVAVYFNGVADDGRKAVFTERFMTVDDTLLTFTISFDNGEPITATDVVIIDTISPFLDTSTFEPGTASHPYAFAWLDDHVACWVFKNIYLPSHDVDPEKSHVFVKYHIDHLETQHSLSEIENKSQVHFANTSLDIATLLEQFGFVDYPLSIEQNRNDLGIEILRGSHAYELEIVTPASCKVVQLTIEIFNEDGVVEFLGKLNNDHPIFLDTSFLKEGRHFLSVYDNRHHESVSYFVSE